VESLLVGGTHPGFVFWFRTIRISDPWNLS